MSSIAKKMSQVFEEIEQPKKSGYLKYAGHEYSTRNDLISVVRKALKGKGVCWSTNAELLKLQPTGDGNLVAAVDVTVRFTDTETGDEMEASAVGGAEMSDGKVVKGAQTQALRTLLSNNFGLHDDMIEGAMASGGGGQSQNTNVHRGQSSQSNGTPLDDIEDTLASIGCSEDQIESFKGYIANVEGVDYIDAASEGRLRVWADRMSEVSADEARQKVMKAIGQ